MPAAWKTRAIDFGDGRPVKAITIPWGDVATAYHSTGIPDVEVYLAAPFGLRAAARLTRYLGWLVRRKAIQGWVGRRIRAGPAGPSEGERRANRCQMWGAVADPAGRTAVARQETPDGYDLTVEAALTAAARVRAARLARATTPRQRRSARTSSWNCPALPGRTSRRHPPAARDYTTTDSGSRVSVPVPPVVRIGRVHRLARLGEPNRPIGRAA